VTLPDRKGYDMEQRGTGDGALEQSSRNDWNNLPPERFYSSAK